MNSSGLLGTPENYQKSMISYMISYIPMIS